jgi:flagellar biosynthesis GTPase FlhF
MTEPVAPENNQDVTKTKEGSIDYQARISELEEKLMVALNTAKSNAEAKARIEKKNQEKADKLKEYEERMAAEKKEAEERQIKAGEYEPLLKEKETAILELKTQMENLQQQTTEAQAAIERRNLETEVYRSLLGKIRPDWVKGKDPVMEAMRMYPFDDLVLDEDKKPTNTEEINKKFFEEFPGFLATSTATTNNGMGNFIGPGTTTKTNIPLDGFGPEIHAICKAESLQPETVKDRLEGKNKEYWRKTWARYIESTKKVF